MQLRKKILLRQKREACWLKQLIAGALLVGAVVLGSGFYEGDAVLIHDSYVVQEGDVLREISEAYLEKNTYGRRYILEFEEGIHELNPWIRKEGLHPGDVILINYWVHKDEVEK